MKDSETIKELYMVHFHNDENDFYKISHTLGGAVLDILAYVSGWWDEEVDVDRPEPLELDDVQYYFEVSGEYANIALLNLDRMTADVISTEKVWKEWEASHA